MARYHDRLDRRISHCPQCDELRWDGRCRRCEQEQA